MKGLPSDPFSLRAMHEVGHKFEGRSGNVSLFNGRFNFRAICNVYKQFALSRLTLK